MIRIVALTETGKALAFRTRDLLVAAGTQTEILVDYKPLPFSEKIQQAFLNGDALLMICATGIVVRTLAPVLQDKQTDPPVLVMDEQGQFVIPLLSGHEGGANEWARQLSELLPARLVITTANTYLKPVYTVGMGCERHCSTDELIALFGSCLKAIDLQPGQIDSLHSIDIKADESGLIGLAEHYGLDFRTWPVSRLKQVEAQLQTPSDYVFETVGVYGVAESAALFAAGHIAAGQAELLLAKQKSRRATCAIARAYRSET